MALTPEEHRHLHAYGFTRVRLAGHAVVLALAALFVLVTLAGVWPPAARHLPWLAVALSLGGLVAYSVSAPDARIARKNVERFARIGQLDQDYVQGLSAEAVPALVHLPEKVRRCVLAEQRRRLTTSDGGWPAANHARSRARAALARAPTAGTDRTASAGTSGGERAPRRPPGFLWALGDRDSGAR